MRQINTRQDREVTSDDDVRPGWFSEEPGFETLTI